MGKKQGAPEPLDETLITRKRKSAAPAKGAIKKQKVVEQKAAKPTEQATNGHKQAPAVKPTKVKKSKKTAPTPPESDGDDDVEDLNSDVLEDEADGMAEDLDFDDDSFGSDADDFADAPSDDDDVELSDSEMPKSKMWSDDEDSDAEETLTAANIAGLSRKLDEQRAQEAAEAEEELQDDALQTNIAAADLSDDEDGPGAGLAPDLQLLRTRITEIVRVLTNFKELGEPGKSTKGEGVTDTAKQNTLSRCLRTSARTTAIRLFWRRSSSLSSRHRKHCNFSTQTRRHVRWLFARTRSEHIDEISRTL